MSGDEITMFRIPYKIDPTKSLFAAIGPYPFAAHIGDSLIVPAHGDNGCYTINAVVPAKAHIRITADEEQATTDAKDFMINIACGVDSEGYLAYSVVSKKPFIASIRGGDVDYIMPVVQIDGGYCAAVLKATEEQVVEAHNEHVSVSCRGKAEK